MLQAHRLSAGAVEAGGSKPMAAARRAPTLMRSAATPVSRLQRLARLLCLLAILALGAPCPAFAQDGWDEWEDDSKGLEPAPTKAAPDSAASSAALEPELPAEDDVSLLGAFFQAQVGGWMSDNVGLSAAFCLNLAEAHALELVASVGGGSHLRAGPALRYRVAASRRVAWFLSAGVLFDVLFATDELTVWSYTTSFGTGLEFGLGDMLYLAVDIALPIRVSPLATSTVLSEHDARELRYGTDEIPFDLGFALVRPGVALGLRL